MTSAHRLQFAVVGLFVAVATASAQTQPPPDVRVAPAWNMWSHGTTLNVFGGAAATSGDRAAVAGGALGWEITPWFSVEGGGSWLDWGQDAHAFTAAATTYLSILTPRPFVPFVSLGAGLYHASFNRSDGTMPGFYRRRMMGMSFEPGYTTTFTDPSIVAGGGLNLFVSRHWTVRPEVTANVVMRDARSFVVTTGIVRLAYHFEDHPVTPRAHVGRAH
jgi:hypothetical protein